MSLELTLKEPKNNFTAAKSTRRLIYEFQNFRLDADHLMLYRGDEESALTPKQVETLLALVEKHGQIVSKDALMKRLWGDTAVEEANLMQNIHFLRKELGNGPDGKPMIETLRRRGYRFTADLQVSGNGLSTASSTETVVSEFPHWFQQRPVALLLAFSGLLGLVVIASSFLFSSEPNPASDRVHFAVLPMRPIDSANRSELYEVGVADLLIHRLNSITGFVARPLSATRNYSAIDQDALAAGREQKVDRVLTSNYQIADGKIRITAQLINVPTGATEDTYLVETDSGNILVSQEAVVNEIVKWLMSRFDGRGATSTAARGTVNEEAYRLYLQAMLLIDRRRPENSKKAREYLEQAVAIDPRYAQAWAAIALAVRYSGRTDVIEIHQELVKAANTALSIDPNVSHAYTALCEDKALYDYDFAGAEALCRQAIRADPTSSTARVAYFWVLLDSGQHDKALDEIRTALELEPLSYVNQREYGTALYRTKRFAEAAAQWKHLMALDPTDGVPYQQLIKTLEADGKEAEAFEWFIKFLIHRKRDPETIERYTNIYQKSGWRGVLLERAKDPPNAPGGGQFAVAVLYARAGEKDLAFEHLEKSLRLREWKLSQLWDSHELHTLRDDPRYKDLLMRVEGL